MKTDLKQFLGNLNDNYARRQSQLENISINYYNIADGFRYARWILETLVSAQDEDE